MRSRRERLLLLNLISDVGSTQLRRLLDAVGDVDRLWASRAQELQQVAGIGPRLAQRIVAGCRDEERLENELRLARRHHVTMITLEDPEYPQPLRAIPDPPLVLYLKGTLEPADEVAVGIVGARHASLYGIRCAEGLGYDLALRGVTVVSGLARGIDGASHRGALKALGRTLAVLGNGLACVYPTEHEDLSAQIAEQGALISEYPMETPPLARNFPRRNRLISGLSLGVVVVEAASRSGALITADCALEQGREVFAVPGPMTAVTSQGTHQLLKQGARLVTSVEDILEELHLSVHPGAGRALSERIAGTTQLLEPEQRVLGCVNDQPRYIDAIAAQSGLDLPEVSSVLLQLELKHVVQQLPGKQFVRKTL